MISYVKIKPAADKAKNWVKGVCTSDDTKPVDGIANGSKLLELDTGKRCVYDEGQTKWIEYGTGEDRSNKPKNVKTEVYEGLLSELLTFENIQKYGAALDAGAIGVAQSLDITDEKMAEIKMGMNYLPPLDDTDLGFFAFGAGIFGRTFFRMLDMASSDWNKTFSDEAAYINYVEKRFKLEAGLSIVVGLTKSSVSGYFAYINTNGNPTIITNSDNDHIDNLGRFRFTFYYMDEGVEPSGGAKVTTETISGPLSTIFTDNGWNEAKFRRLGEDIRAGQASARLTVTMGAHYFDAQLMVAGSASSAETMVLATAFFTVTLNDPVVKIVWSFEDEAGIEGVIMMCSPSTEAWDIIDDSAFSQMTGQKSYDLVITRIEEE